MIQKLHLDHTMFCVLLTYMKVNFVLREKRVSFHAAEHFLATLYSESVSQYTQSQNLYVWECVAFYIDGDFVIFPRSNKIAQVQQKKFSLHKKLDLNMNKNVEVTSHRDNILRT